MRILLEFKGFIRMSRMSQVIKFLWRESDLSRDEEW